MWALADAHIGYISAFDVYTGKTANTQEVGLGTRVVKTLCHNFRDSQQHIYFDNFFTSVGLLIDLSKMGLYGCGTLRTNRKGFPITLKDVAKKGLGERGKSQTEQYKNLTVSVWQDNRPVCVAASNSDPTTSELVKRKKRDGSHDNFSCPQAVYLYNRYMGGVDRNDQLRGYYQVRLKGRKYYKYIFWFLFDLAITNMLF